MVFSGRFYGENMNISSVNIFIRLQAADAASPPFVGVTKGSTLEQKECYNMLSSRVTQSGEIENYVMNNINYDARSLLFTIYGLY